MINLEAIYTESKIDLNKVTAAGDVSCRAAVSTCSNIPSALANDQSSFKVVTSGFYNDSPTGVQTLTTLSANPRTFQRRITHNWGGYAYGGNVSFDAWQEVYTTASSFYNDLTFAKSSTYNIGSTTSTVNNLYLQNAATVVSDENHKTDIHDIPQPVLEAWGKVNFQMYKLKDAIAEKGEVDARYHFGVIAQRVKEVFEANNIDWTQYGILIYEKWDAVKAVPYSPAVYDKDGKMTTPEVQAVEGREAGEIYMIRYEECMILEMAYQRYRLDLIEAKLNKS